MKNIICPECKKEKRHHAGGFCKTCYSKFRMREDRKKYPEKYKKIAKDRWKGEYREKNNKWRKERYQHHHKEEREKQSIYREAHKEEQQKYMKKYYRDNIERIKRKNKEYDVNNRDKKKEFKRLQDWVVKQPIEKMRELWKTQSQRRAARKKGLPSTLTHKQWENIKNIYSHCCAYCEKEKPLSQDHIIPILKGGGHIYENIVPACKSCNSKKGARDVYTVFPNFVKKH